MQFPLGIKPELRLNFDYVFLLADDTVSNQKRIYEHYAGIFPNFEAFRQVFSQLTADYGTMVIVNRGVRDNVLEKVFYYKAPDVSNSGIIIGGNQYRKFDKLNYDPEWSKHQNERFDADTAFSKKRLQGGTKLTVNKVKQPKKGTK